MTHARARLTIGMSGVGTIVVASVAALLLGLPAAWLPVDGGGPGRDALALLAVLGLHALLLAPFDLFGGFVIPRRFGRDGRSFGSFVLRWARGVAVQTTLILAAAVAVLAAGRAGGDVAGAAMFLVIMTALLVAQLPLARVLGGLRGVGRDGRTVTLRSGDGGFTGGVVGVPGLDRLVVPERWAGALGPDGLRMQLVRWRAACASGSRALGVSVALSWNMAGFLVALQLPGAGLASVAGLVTTSLGFTLWSFAGLLLLPTLSRRAVFAVDRLGHREAHGHHALESAMDCLDRLQDDEPSRGAVIESIFHPIPALERRRAALASGDAPGIGAWQSARLALFLSWAGLGLLARAVHCNAGRPELWVMLPCD